MHKHIYIFQFSFFLPDFMFNSCMVIKHVESLKVTSKNTVAILPKKHTNEGLAFA